MFGNLFKELKFTPEKVFKNGPRVYVAGGWVQGDGRIRAVFKGVFEEGTELTNHNLKKEASFLKSLPTYLAQDIPALFETGELGGKAWYLVEWVWPGDTQNVGESNFLFKDTFFTQSNLIWCLKVIVALRRFSGEIPPRFAREIAETVYGLTDYRGLLEPLGKKYFDQETLAAVRQFLDAVEPIYDRANRTTITHHEFYGSQILAADRGLKICDWENLGWGHPLRDFTGVWIRAFLNPAWQKKFLDNFRKDLRMGSKELEILFGVEKILQSFGNLTHFDQTRLPEEISRRKEAMTFFRRCVVETVEV